MRIYFVRHGESTGNVQGVHQHSGEELTSKGLQQAKTLAKRFAKISVDAIFSSSYTRARQTAEEIAKVTRHKVIFTSLLTEVKRPTEIEKRKFNDPEAVRIKNLIREHVDDPEWHFSDEENFYDFKERIEEFLVYVSKRKEQRLAVVCHGFVMRMIVGIMMFGGKEFTRHMYEHFLTFMEMSNTALTVCELRENGSWHLITWNDHAHLG
jgi:broad specificity phosphatase PhoE